MAVKDNLELKKYSGLVETLKSRVASASPTPTQSDINTQTKLFKAQDELTRAEKDYLQKKWYGEDTTVTPEKPVEEKRGVFMRTLDALSTPLYGVVGVAESALGKGTEQGVLANIKSNIGERETFSDLLRKEGAPWAVSAPVGFALDVFFDPINWITAGTAATIPRLATGLIKGAAKEGGIKGALKGVALAGRSSAAARLLSSPAKLIPGKIGKAVKEGTGVSARESFNVLADIDPIKMAESGGNAWQSFVRKGTTKVSEAVNRGPEWIKKAREVFLPERDWVQRKMLEADTLRNDPSYVRGTPRQQMEQIENIVYGGSKYNSLSDMVSGKNPVDVRPDVVPKFSRQGRATLQKQYNEGAYLATDGSHLAYEANPDRVTSQLKGEAINDSVVKTFNEELKAAAIELSRDETGIKFYDDAAKRFRGIKVGDVNVGEKIADGYRFVIDMFKGAKVLQNVPSYPIAAASNNTFTLMSGVKAWGKRYLSDLYNSYKAVFNKPTEEFLQSLEHVGLANFIRKYDKLAAGTIAIGPNIFDSRRFVDSVMERINKIDPGFLNSTVNDAEVMSGIESRYKSALERYSRAKEIPFESTTPVQRREFALAKEELSKATLLKNSKELARNDEFRKVAEETRQVMSELVRDGGTSFFTNEIFMSKFGRFVHQLEMSDSPIKKMIAKTFTTPANWYEKIDATNKLAMTSYLSKGVDQDELAKLAAWVKLNDGDVVKDVVTGLYKFKPQKALEIALATYMNYGTLPAAIRVLRTAPIFGSPFVSFTYLMALKTGKTALYNPSFFNKAGFMMNAISNGKSPLENEQLKNGEYYRNFNEYGFVRLPFFQRNPIYLNVANMLPYYTMQMVKSTEREYEDKVPKTITKIFDKIPMFKTPEGQVLFDYIVQPLLLRDTNPVNAFNQPIWPTDASALEKVGYTTRQLAESMTPGFAGYAGFPVGLLGGEQTPGSVSRAVTESIPFGYRFRQSAYATKGRSALGIPTKEDPSVKAWRTFMNMTTGIPYYRMNLTYSTNKKK